VPEPGKHPHADIMGLLMLVKASFGLFALALSGILVVNLLAGLMGRERRSIGVLKAIGASRRQIAAIYFAESLLLGAAAVALAAPAGLLGGGFLTRAMSVLLNFDIQSFAVPAWVYLLEAAAGLALPVLAAIVPVWKGSGISVREALGPAGDGEAAFGSRRL